MDTTNIYAARRARWSIVSVYRANSGGSTGATETISATSGTVNISSGTTFARFAGASFSGTINLPATAPDRAALTVAFGAIGNGAGFGTVIWGNTLSTYNLPSGVADGASVSFVFDSAAAKWRVVGVVS